MPKQPVTIFYLGTKRGFSDRHYDAFIKEDSDLIHYPINQSIGFPAKLFVKRGIAKPPAWEEFLRPGFPDLSLPESHSPSAVLILSQTQSGSRHWFACSFGAGRHLLKPARIERNFGLKTTLNAIYAEGVSEDQTNRIRSVTAKTVSQNTLHTKRQTDTNALFEAFGVDADTDFLKNVSGKPFDERLGSIMTGADSVTVRIDESIRRLDTLCLLLHAMFRSNKYKERFEWIDKIKFVADDELRNILLSLLASHVRDHNIEGLILAIPKILNWEDVDHIEASWLPRQELEEVQLEDFVSFLRNTDRLQELTWLQLKDKYRLFAKDSTDTILGGGSLLKCISGQISHNDKTFILSEGDFFEIESDFIEALDQEISEIGESTANLPPSRDDMPEAEYNENAANHSEEHILLDRRTVNITSRTNPIEICDVLTANKKMIHVKRKLVSSSLSHLFSQGFVSGDLLVTSSEFRDACVRKIDEAAQERNPGDSNYRNQFNFIQSNAVEPWDIEVVYAIAAKWRGRSLTDALPFFSKVNLRRVSRDLRRLGFRVTHLRIDVV